MLSVLETCHVDQPIERIIDDGSGVTHPSVMLEHKPTRPVPTMLVQRELNYLEWLGSRCRGDGRVIELGCLLGGSTLALLSKLDPSTHIMSYDAFQIPSEMRERAVGHLAQYGLKPGMQFRSTFENFTRDWQYRIDVRDGWIPEWDSDNDADRVYPESEPIELLFCDIAKTWGVHQTVLRTFVPHLIEGATYVQQDFFDIQTPWIPLHMWQLRDILRPLDIIHGTPTASFVRTRADQSVLDDLWDESEESQVIEDAWKDVIIFWSQHIGNDAAQVFHGHAFKLAIAQGRYEDAVPHGRAYEQWCRTAQSEHSYYSTYWEDLVWDIAEGAYNGAEQSADLMALCAESIARGSRASRPRPGDRTPHCPEAQRVDVWSKIIERMEHDDHRKRFLYGAGQHTRWLLDQFGDAVTKLIEGVIDDQPSEGMMHGLPVVSTDELALDVDTPISIYPSSDAFETQMRYNLSMRFSDQPHVQIERVYTAPEFASRLESKWAYVVEPIAETNRDLVAPGDTDTGASMHRNALGIPSERGWLSELLGAYQRPAWSKDHLHLNECAFLWDFIEAAQPKTIIEIGTASGVSTAMMLHAMDILCPDDALVYSFDIASSCYFDPTRPLASAVGEMSPHLIHRARTHSGTNASDAASLFQPQSVDLVLIDGEHANPAPAIDLLALSHVIRPNAWVILHDIELHNITSIERGGSWDHSGAGRLFDRWPFEKYQLAGLTPEGRNIGAIRFPVLTREAIDALLPLIAGPWESESESIRNAQNARRVLDRTL